MLPQPERKLRAVGVGGHLFALQALVSLLHMRASEALCGRGTNRPEGERSTGSAVSAGMGD